MRYGHKWLLSLSANVSTLFLSAAASLAAPAWYGANGGFIADTNNAAVAAAAPTVPDYFQHQYWIPRPVGNTFVSNNGWETYAVQSGTFGSGWCGFTSYNDLFYDLQSRGYTFSNLADPTAGAWYNATYGAGNAPVSATSSNITKTAYYFAANLPRAGTGGVSAYGVTLQSFLNANVNNNAANNGMARLISQNYTVSQATGNVSYWSYSAGGYVSTKSNVFNFTNKQLQAGSDVAYQLYTTPQNARQKGLWWGNHVVAVSGIDTNTNTVFVADPDSNPNPNAPPATGSAPSNWPFPGTIPAGLKTVPGAALPVPANPDSTNAGTYNSFYDDFKFNNAVAASAQAPQFSNSSLGFIYTIQQSGVKNINARQRVRGPAVAGASHALVAPTEEETDITLQVPTDLGSVDKVLIEPSTATVDPTLDPTADTLVDDTHPASAWSDTMDPTDPFGNTLADNAIEYDLTAGNALQPGDTADVNLATTSDFSTAGYDVLYHVQGTASDQWDVEMVAGSQFDPSDSPANDQLLPEPSAIMLLGVGAMTLSQRRRARSILAIV